MNGQFRTPRHIIKLMVDSAIRPVAPPASWSRLPLDDRGTNGDLYESGASMPCSSMFLLPAPERSESRAGFQPGLKWALGPLTLEGSAVDPYR